MKTIIKKISQKNGFTLSEMLMAIIILLMVTSVVAGGVPVASRAYNQIISSANSQMLLSSTLTKLRDELTDATSVTVETEGIKVIHYVSKFGGQSHVRFKDDGVFIQSSNLGSEEYSFIAESASSDVGLKLTIGSLGYDEINNLVTIGGIKVRTIDGNSQLAELSEFDIRIIGKQQ